MKVQAVLFDMDGVIINSGADISLSVNAALEAFGYKTLPKDVLVSFVGDGAKKLLIRALEYQNADAANMKNFQEFFEWYVDWYRKNPVNKTVLYPGMYELLETLKEKSVYAAVVSNKPLSVAQTILMHFKIGGFFDAVIGPERLSKIKPDPEGLALATSDIEKKCGVRLERNRIVMVGDSASDIQAGRAFGCMTCAVTEGLWNREKLLEEKADIVVPYAGDLKNSGLFSA